MPELPEVLPPPRRGNGIRFMTVTREKKGRVGGVFKVIWSRIERQEEEMLQPRKEIKGAAATVSVGRGLTLNLGDFESARVDEYVTLPCNATAEEVEATRAELTKEIEGHVEAQRVRIKGSLADKVSCVKAGLLKQGDFDAGTWAAIEKSLPPGK